MRRERLRVKVCRKCLRVSPINDFYNNRFNSDGKDVYDKNCRSEINAEWCTKHKDKRYLIQWRYRNKQWFKINGSMPN